MSAPLYLLDRPLAGLAPGATLVLDGEEGRHAATVRRTRPGERVDVADGAGQVARCTVDAVAAGRLELRVDAVDAVPQRDPRLVLVQALAKGGRDELAVETSTELGVDAVIAWQAERSVVRWEGERGERARRKWQQAARAAAKQSRRPWVPAVEGPVGSAALGSRIGTVVASGGAALLLHEAASERLATLTPQDVSGELLVIVGPEGGVGADEVGLLCAAGARAVRLGPEVLRSSSAGPAAIAVLSARLGRWG